jgi:hypothetical protein
MSPMMNSTSDRRQVAPQRAPGDRREPVVVVAVDGSDASVRALVWAFRHATEAGLEVEALTTWPLHGPVFVREVAGHFCEPRWRAREVQAEAVARAMAVVEDAPACHLRVINADLADALERASRRAALVVVGSDRTSDTERPGTLAERVQHKTSAPLVVVGPEGSVPARGGSAAQARGPL